MNGRRRATGKTTDFLDWCFADRHRSILWAVGIAGVVYVLGVIYSKPADLITALTMPPFVGAACFAAMFLVLGFQLINPFSTPKSMDVAEIFFTVFGGFVGGGCVVLFGIWQLFGESPYDVAVLAAELAGLWCGICVIHNMRY